MKFIVVGCVMPAAILILVGWLTLSVSAEAEQAPGPVRTMQQLVAVDSSGNGNDGVNQGRPTVGLPGHRGTSYSFRHEGAWIQVASTPRLNPGVNDFSFSASVSLTSAPRDGVTYDIIRKGLAWTPGGEFKVEVISGGLVQCSAKDSDGLEESITGPDVSIADGAWHRIGCARTGPTWSVRVDDVVRTETVDFGSIANTMALSIGSKYGREDGQPGRVDDVRLVIADGSGTTDPWRGPLRGWWRLDEPAS